MSGSFSGSRAVATAAVAVLLVIATATTTSVVMRPTRATVVTRADVLRVAVIGDTYSAGSNNSVVWPTLLAAATDLSVSNVAFPGAGYLGGEGESGPFADQLVKATAVKPNVVVVFGGINDAGKSDDLVTQAAADLFGRLARELPGTELLVFGPIWYLPELPESFYRVDAAIAAAAQRSNVRYTSLIREQWLTGDGMIQQDRVNPTDAGQVVLERNLGPLIAKQIRERDTGVRR